MVLVDKRVGFLQFVYHFEFFFLFFNREEKHFLAIFIFLYEWRCLKAFLNFNVENIGKRFLICNVVNLDILIQFNNIVSASNLQNQEIRNTVYFGLYR